MASSSKHVTVEDASPSPPPLPTESPSSTINPNAKDVQPQDQPIASLGGDDEEADEDDDDEEEGEDEDGEDQEEWDPSAERLPGDPSAAAKGKGKAETQGDTSSQPWQAVWSPEQNAWYFWNTQTGAVTWTNPLEPPSGASASTPVQPPLPAGPPPPKGDSATPAQFGIPPDIDPDLAYLLPPSQRGGPSAQPGAQTALFNARTGRFTPADYAYSVDHLDEYNRAKRMNSHYFDVEAWEREKAEEHAKRKRDEEMGVTGNKKLTKKDMERFRKKAIEKRYRKQAWLRD